MKSIITNTKVPQQTLTIDQALQQAIDHHLVDQHQEAEKLYQAILQIHPNHPETNHNMGILAVQMKQPVASLPHFMKALEANPTYGRYWASYIDALFQANQLESAREVLTIAQQQGLQSDDLEALAVLLENASHITEQVNAEYQHTFKESLPVSSTVPQNNKKKTKTKPDKSTSKSILHKGKNPSPQEINTLISMFTEERYTEAITLAQTMTERFPRHGFAWKALGALFKQMGRNADALIPMQKAVTLSPTDAEAQNNLGLTLQGLGRLDEAEVSYRRAIKIQYNYAEAHYNLGTVLFDLGRLDEAEVSYRRVLQIKPNHADAHYNLSNILKDLGQLDKAEVGYRRTLEIKPTAEAYNNLGLTLKSLNRLDEAEANHRWSLQIDPDYVGAHSNLGDVLKEMGRLEEAEACYRRALEIQPDFVEAHYSLGNALNDMGRLEEAEASYRRILEIKPNLAEMHSNLGNTLRIMGRLNEAEACQRQALKIKSDYAEGHINLSLTLLELSRLNEAEVSCRLALQIKPDLAEAHYNLGIILMGLARQDEAEGCYQRTLEIKPDYVEAHNNLAIILTTQGQLDEAESYYRRALEIKPNYVTAHSNLIFTLDLMIDRAPSSLLEERKRWDAAHAAHLLKPQTHTNIPDPERRIRIGYVSADFRDHSAAKVFGGMLTHYDRSQFEVFAYANIREKNDKFTELFKQNVTAWRNIIGLSDDAVAKMIREDQIDVLVDLSGHTAGNRLLVFARKPAPIQITAWGYATGTGMQAMDVFFADPVVVPPQEKHYFTEEVRYLPNVVGSFFTEPFPAVNELPALSDGIITFGSFNRLEKISAEAYRAWAEILLEAPRSRLILKTNALADLKTRESIIGHFTKVGVAADRIIMQGKTSWREHMQAYHQVDIALDPFPHGGGVTSLECLMMGVPVMTLRWPTIAGRLSASIMTTLGLTDWIAETPKEYVELAAKKATDLQSLATLRQQLRGIFTASVIGDQAAYARAVEQEYRQLWREWCASRSPKGHTRV